MISYIELTLCYDIGMGSFNLSPGPHERFLTSSFSLCFYSCSIYRCAAATLPLPNSKVTLAQQQPYRCAAVNNFDGSVQGKRIIK